MTVETVTNSVEQRSMFMGVEQAAMTTLRRDNKLLNETEWVLAPTEAVENGKNPFVTLPDEFQKSQAVENVRKNPFVTLPDELQKSRGVKNQQQEEQALDGKRDGKNFVSNIAPLSTDEKSNVEALHLLQEAFTSNKGTLDLSNKFLSHIPESIGQIVGLRSLDLSNNQLKLLPDSISRLVNLESLKLYSNQLKALPNSIGLLPKLKYLDVSSNAIEKLPESLGRCSSLLEFNANFNHIEFVPASFGFMLVCLEKLELHLNKLTSIPASLCNLKSLKYLDLHMNRLRSLPSSIGNLTQLEYLDVSSNFDDLLSVPESVGFLVALTYCDLSYNQIKELPNSIGRLEKLNTLKLDGNPLVFPPMEVVEHSHDAVMQYLHQRYMSTVEGDLQVSASQKGLIYTGTNDYNPWIPACAGNSPLAVWIGSICGNMGNVLSGGTGDFFRFQQHHSDEILDQRL